MPEHPDLVEWALGQLDSEDELALEAHLRTCPDCRATADELLGAHVAMQRAAPPIEVPPGLEARADEILLSVTVRDAMMSLSPAHREVLELIYDEDLKLGEIACKLDVPLGTVKTRAFYALRAMREALRDRGFDA